MYLPAQDTDSQCVAGGRVHLCNSSCLLILPDSHTGVSGGGSASALKEHEDSGAIMLTSVFIYSLTGGLLLSFSSEDHFHLFHLLLRFEIVMHLTLDRSCGCARTRTRAQ